MGQALRGGQLPPRELGRAGATPGAVPGRFWCIIFSDLSSVIFFQLSLFPAIPFSRYPFFPLSFFPLPFFPLSLFRQLRWRFLTGFHKSPGSYAKYLDNQEVV